MQARVLALAGDFPALWNNPATPMRERKRLLRLLITDVTLTRAGDGAICCQVRFTGGQHHILTLPRPLTAAEQHTTVELISQLLDDHAFHQIAAILNGRGITGGWGRAFTVPNLGALCRARGLGTHASRLRAAGMLTAGQIAAGFKVTPQTIRKWHRRGLITARRTGGRGEFLFHPGQHRPPGTGNAITGGQLAARRGVSRSAVCKWHQLGLIRSLGTDGTGRNLYHPGQQAPSREQIRTARAARRKCQTPVPSSVPEGTTPPIATPGTGSST